VEVDFVFFFYKRIVLVCVRKTPPLLKSHPFLGDSIAVKAGVQ